MTTETRVPTSVAPVSDTEPRRCIGVMPVADAKRLVWALALSGVPVTASPDARDPKRFHVAVREADAQLPVIWIIGIRGEATDPKPCTGEASVQHTAGDIADRSTDVA